MSGHRVRAVVGIGVALLVAGCGTRASREESSAGESAGPIVSVRIRALESRTVEDLVTAPGEWRSSGELAIVAPFAATVESLRPRIGDEVRQGETVGSLVPRESDAALRGAELLVREARDSLARAEAEQALRAARAGLVRVPLTAPRTGEVTRRTVVAGAQVAEGSEILAIVPRDAVRFEAHVAAGDAARVRSGQRASVTSEGQPPRAATVDRLLPAAGTGDQAALAWLAPVGASPAPLLGEFGTARIVVGAPHRAPAVPDSAVVEDDLTGATRIAVVGPDGRAHWRTVTLGVGFGGWHELRGQSPPAGTRVIVEGQHGLPEGTRVQPAP